MKKHVYLTETVRHELRMLYWLSGRQSQVSLDNNVLIYKGILKPMFVESDRVFCMSFELFMIRRCVQFIRRSKDLQKIQSESTNIPPLFGLETKNHFTCELYFSFQYNHLNSMLLVERYSNFCVHLLQHFQIGFRFSNNFII